MKKIVLCTVTCCLVFVLAPLRSESVVARQIVVEDLLDLRDVSDVRLSPKGTQIAFILTSIEKPSGRERSNIWTTSSGSGPCSQLTEGEFSDTMPRWSPDGRQIAFASNRDGHHSLWVVDVDSKHLQLVADWPQSNFYISKSGEALAWSSDGKDIAFVAAESAANPQLTDPRVITRIQYKSRTSLADNANTQIFVVSIESHAVRQLTHGNNNAHSISWSSRGEIAFLSSRASDPDKDFHYDIYLLDPKTDSERQLTHASGVAFSPVWSPDGNSIAYLATARRLTTIDSIAEDTHVWMINRDGGSGISMDQGLDRRAASPQWSPDGKSIYFLAGNEGEVDIFQTDISVGGKPRVIINGPATIRSFSIGGSRLAFIRTDDLKPLEVWTATSDGSNPIQLSSFNSQLVDSWKLSQPKAFWFKSFDGRSVQGWLMPPLDQSPERRSPLILTVHGGPHGMYGYGFDFSNQFYAAHGYAVLYINPRGSAGYGQSFSDGCVNDWGGGDYKDLMAGLDYALAQNPWIDSGHLAITGLSYGGFMTNWAITQTHRFKAAVAMSSLSNLISFYGTSLYQDLIHAEFNGMPWDSNNYEVLWKHSPLAFVQNATTPTMFIHGETDNDVSMIEAEQMYQSMRRRGIDAALVLYPREGHGLHEPLHRVDQLKRSLAWFDQYLSN